MKKAFSILILISVIMAVSCSGNSEDNENIDDSGAKDSGNDENTEENENNSEESENDEKTSGEKDSDDDGENSENANDDSKEEEDDFDYGQDPEPEESEDYDSEVDHDESGCDIPEYMKETYDAESYMTFSFRGRINYDESNPEHGEGSFKTKLRGDYINIGEEIHTAYLGTAYKIYIETMGFADEDKGIINYSEISIDFQDILDAEEGGYNFLDISETGINTNIKLYRGLVDSKGGIKKLCLEAVPTGEADSGGFYLCETDYSYMDFNDDESEYIDVTGNVVLFDDSEYLERVNGMRCVCDNGVGGWRNCEEGVPSSYGLLRSKIESVPSKYGNYEGYVFDESKLFPEGNFNQKYAEEHSEGIWREHNYSPPPLNGGLNIGSYSEEMGDGLYRFKIPIPPSESRSIGLLSKDSSKNMIIYRQQSFEHDLETETKYWLNAYFPDSINEGDKITAGGKPENVKIIAYESKDSCVIAVGCGGHLLITEAVGIKESEGGILAFETEISDNTKYNLFMYHPDEAPESCYIENYFSDMGFEDIKYCEKE